VVFTRVRANGWRNLRPLELEFDPTASLNVLYGQNGQGKTNLIEALYFLASFRSFRTSQAADLVQRGVGEARVSADWRTKDLDRTVEVSLGAAALRGRPVEGGEGDPTGKGAGARPATVTRTIQVDGKLVRGEFVAAPDADQWCDAEVLRILRRRSLAARASSQGDASKEQSRGIQPGHYGFWCRRL